jgi:hypothetical protein
MPPDVVEDGPDWGEPDFCDETHAWRLERDRNGRIVSHRVPVWLPPLSSFVRPRGAAREPRRGNGRPGSRRVARTNGARGDPDSEPPLQVVPLARFRRDVDAWLEAVGR